MNTLNRKTTLILMLIWSIILFAQKPTTQKNTKMEKVLLIGKLQINIPKYDTLTSKNVELYSATNLMEVKSAFEETKNQIDIVIMGAGIDLEKRLEIVQYIFQHSNKATVHMKDKDSGKEGFIPFINGVLNGLVN